MRFFFVGNPNTGKSTIFNLLTNSSRHTGNWHGVTVETFSKQVENDEFVDIPGIYSISNPVSIEEENAVSFITSNSGMLLNICDINNIERNLFLTIQLVNAGYKTILLVNKITKKANKIINIKKLSDMLGIQVVSLDKKKKIEILSEIKSISHKNPTAICDNSVESIYKFVDKIMANCISETEKFKQVKIDKFVLNKFSCFFVFAFVFGVIFFLTFSSIGLMFSSLIRKSVDLFFAFIIQNLNITNVIVLNFFNNCLLTGVGGVLSFLPQILILNFCLNVLEESGYLSRIAFMFDEFLSRVGLSGKSIFSIIMGVGCTATAINTAQNMTDKSSKIKIAMLTPNISCSAKLPIYLAVGGAFFGRYNIFVILILYFIGIFLMIIQAKILKKFIVSSEDFVMEFPSYRLPRLKSVIKNLAGICKNFIIKIGSVVLVFSTLIWFLQNFSFGFKYVGAKGEASMLVNISKFLLPIFKPLGFNSWGIVASLISGIVAKEMVVSTISMLNSCGAEFAFGLFDSQNAVCFSALSCVSFLIFCLLYTPCITAISMQKQMVGRKWTIISVLAQLFIAYLTSMIIFFLLNILSFEWAFFAIILAIIVFVGYMLISKKKCGNCNECGKCKL